LGQDATPEQIRALRADLGLDQPFFVQFWHFLSNAVQGEFGLSLRQGAKVSRLIAERFPRHDGNWPPLLPCWRWHWAFRWACIPPCAEARS
jgi:hypothetical protein